MKVFISWSGEPSREVAELFKVWLKCVIQACDPWVSSQDIQSGSWWFNEIGDQLAGTSIGIVCLTKANKDKPWILFETGALTKGLSTSRVCPFLIDLTPVDLVPPLSQLNLTSSEKMDVRKLVNTINGSLKEGQLNNEVLSTVFETYWPQFENAFNKIKDGIDHSPESPSRDEKDILSELLSTVRGLDKRLRNIEFIDQSKKQNSEDINSFINESMDKHAYSFLTMHYDKGTDIESAIEYAIERFPTFAKKHIFRIARSAYKIEKDS